MKKALLITILLLFLASFLNAKGLYNFDDKRNFYQSKLPNKFHKRKQLNVENWFHIGIGASGFTYFLWDADKNYEYFINTKSSPYIGFSYMPEVTIILGDRIGWYLSLGWTGMSEFYNMWHDQTANTIPPTRVNQTPIVGMTGLSFAIYGYEGEGFGNGVRDAYFFPAPARLSIGGGFGNFRWDGNSGYVQGAVAVISLEWYLFLLNFGT